MAKLIIDPTLPYTIDKKKVIMKNVLMLAAFSLITLHIYCADPQQQLGSFLAQQVFDLQNNGPTTDKYQNAKMAIHFIVPAVTAPLSQEERTQKIELIKDLFTFSHSQYITAITCLETHEWFIFFNKLHEKDVDDIKKMYDSKAEKQISLIKKDKTTKQEALTANKEHTFLLFVCDALLTSDENELKTARTYCMLSKTIQDIKAKWKPKV